MKFPKSSPVVTPLAFRKLTAALAQWPSVSGKAADSSDGVMLMPVRARLPLASPAMTAMRCALPSAAGSAAWSAPVWWS